MKQLVIQKEKPQTFSLQSSPYPRRKISENFYLESLLAQEADCEEE